MPLRPLRALLKPGGKRLPEARPTAMASTRRGKSCDSGRAPSSRCAKLPRDKGGVVDERLRVYGTRRQRLVDANVHLSAQACRQHPEHGLRGSRKGGGFDQGGSGVIVGVMVTE